LASGVIAGKGGAITVVGGAVGATGHVREGAPVYYNVLASLSGDGKREVKELNSSPPHIPGGSPTPWVSP